MTIKEFAQLCGCNTQTLRYYDRIGLLKPARVDPGSGYRHYESRQAIDFVKIKNLQAADFTIEEIKGLLTSSDRQVYDAFAGKIQAQTQKLEHIRNIQRSYLAEKNSMEKIVYSMTDYLLSQCQQPQILEEFGLSEKEAPAILALLRDYMNDAVSRELPKGEPRMTVNDREYRGEGEILAQIRSFSKENLADTVLLHTGPGYSMDQSSDPEPDFANYTVVFERRGWAHIRDFFDDIPLLQEGKTYCLWARTGNMEYSDDLSFPMFLMGAVLYRQNLRNVTVNASCSTVADCENRFKLLCEAGSKEKRHRREGTEAGR